VVTSQWSEALPMAQLLPFITAKGALSSFAKALATELASKGISVNIVSPGLADTHLIADISEKDRLLIASKAPLRRLATPEDIAGAIGFLASSQSAYLTGETIRVNGGQSML
jgi:3-oxoacyl-[acyl-carrier protein] reductase